MINYISLITALAISGVSAYFSIIGLTAIFSGSYWPVIIMGSALEVGKIVTSSWLYRNWRSVPLLLKGYLTIAVIVLMFISSMGIFGYLSKAHIEQSLNTTQSDQLEVIQNKIESEKNIIGDIDLQIRQIDEAVKKQVDNGKALSSISLAESQRRQRNLLVKHRDDETKILGELQTQAISTKSAVKRLEAEVGPIRYIAGMIYDNADPGQLESAVKIITIIIVIVFDPLALALLLAANHGLLQHKNNTTNILQTPHKENILHIDI